MQDNKKTEIPQSLNIDEEKDLADGRALKAMVEDNPGWQIIKGWLEDMAFHSWVDPREVTDPKEWQWRELNAFHAANMAKELLDNVARVVSRADYLDKVRRGEIDRKRMQI